MALTKVWYTAWSSAFSSLSAGVGGVFSMEREAQNFLKIQAFIRLLKVSFNAATTCCLIEVRGIVVTSSVVFCTLLLSANFFYLILGQFCDQMSDAKKCRSRRFPQKWHQHYLRYFFRALGIWICKKILRPSNNRYESNWGPMTHSNFVLILGSNFACLSTGNIPVLSNTKINYNTRRLATKIRLAKLAEKYPLCLSTQIFRTSVDSW